MDGALVEALTGSLGAAGKSSLKDSQPASTMLVAIMAAIPALRMAREPIGVG